MPECLVGVPAENFGRIHHLPPAQLAAVIDGMRDRGVNRDDVWLSEQGRDVKQRVESLTDDLAAKPYARVSSVAWPPSGERHAGAPGDAPA